MGIFTPRQRWTRCILQPEPTGPHVNDVPEQKTPRKNLLHVMMKSLVLVIRGVWSTPSQPLLPGPLCHRIAVLVWLQSIRQIDQFKMFVLKKGIFDVMI